MEESKIELLVEIRILMDIMKEMLAKLDTAYRSLNEIVESDS